MKILLIARSVNIGLLTETEQGLPPIKGISPIHFFFKKKHPDWVVETIDTRDRSIEETLTYIKQFSPDFIGVSLYVWNCNWFDTLILSLPSHKFFIGGPSAYRYMQKPLPKNVIFVTIGEGEKITIDSLDEYLEKGKVEDKRGILTATQNETSPAIFEDFILDESSYLEEELEGSDPNGITAWELSRGCPFNCSFCMWSHSEGHKVRSVSFERFKKELHLIVDKHKLHNVFVADATFDYDKNRAKTLLQYIADNSSEETIFNFEMRSELIDEDIAKILTQFNAHVEIGLQSLDPKVLKLINRPTNFEKFWQGIDLLNKYNVNYNVDFIYMLPGQTNESFINDVDTAILRGVRYLSLNHLHLYPGIKLWEERDTFVKTFKTDSLSGEIFFVEETKDISKDQVQKLQEITKGLVLIASDSFEVRRLENDTYNQRPVEWRCISDPRNYIQSLCLKLNLRPSELVQKFR